MRTDAPALRLLWSVAVLAFFPAGAGSGVGTLVGSPLGSAAVILLWAYAIEAAAGYLPSGAFIQRFMPNLNSVYATGQDAAVLLPPWGQNAALLYVCSLSTAVFVIAAAERTLRGWLTQITCRSRIGPMPTCRVTGCWPGSASAYCVLAESN
jgi:ABC-2 type transport system permease protein